jgi:transcriptional regulator with XRE-family HTH domain
MLHDELRRGREAAGLSQTQLATLAGIPRNQVARAERGENITLDTLRKIVIHLPIQELPLLEKVNLSVDFYPQPEKVFEATVVSVQKIAEAMLAAIQASMDAQEALGKARKAEPLPDVGSEPTAEIDPRLLLRRMAVKLRETFPNSDTFPDRDTA